MTGLATIIGRTAASALAFAAAAPAHASETIAYEPAPQWTRSAAPAAKAPAPDADALIVAHNQQTRIDAGAITTFADDAIRVINPQMLTALGNLTAQWQPDTQSVVVHTVTIEREGAMLDILAKGTRFEVLRREQNMERLMLDGSLTATMQLEGLKIGDIIHFAYSTVTRDPSLGGHVNGVIDLPAAPAVAGTALVALDWPADTPLRHVEPADADAELASAGGRTRLVIDHLLPKQPEMPGDAPARYGLGPRVEFSDFASWSDVSKTASRLFEERAAIAPGSALATKVASIAAASDDPLTRMAAAVRAAQEDVRYLYVGLDFGNYTPQDPAKTWDLRYGDCKAKSLLLVAMLRALGIDAVPAMASLGQGDGLADRLPGFHAFNHVIVRAAAGGRTYWIDATMTGTRQADLAVAPDYRYALPLLPAGADLTPIPFTPLAAPTIEADIRYDLGGAIGLPPSYDATIVLRGPVVDMVKSARAAVDAPAFAEILENVVTSSAGDGIVVDQKIAFADDGASATITARGLGNFVFTWRDGRYRTTLSPPVQNFSLDVDRGRTAWRAIPVATGDRDYMVRHLRYTLPKAIGPFALEGPAQYDGTLAGFALRHDYAIADAVLSGTESNRTVRAEIPAEELPAIRSTIARAQAKKLEVVAPKSLVSRQAELRRAFLAGKHKPLVALYDASVAKEKPDDTTALTNRAIFWTGLHEYARAAQDLRRIVEIDPSVDNRVLLARRLIGAGDPAAAVAQVALARETDPSSQSALEVLVEAEVERQDYAAALAAIDAAANLGIDDKDIVRLKAETLAEAGRAAEAVALLDGEIAASRTASGLYAARCKVKAMRAVDLPGALKDCTRAIETREDPIDELQARGLAYWREHRRDEALADWTAARDLDPDNAASWFLLGIAHGKQSADGREALAIAELIDPKVSADYAAIGIKP